MRVGGLILFSRAAAQRGSPPRTVAYPTKSRSSAAAASWSESIESLSVFYSWLQTGAERMSQPLSPCFTLSHPARSVVVKTTPSSPWDRRRNSLARSLFGTLDLRTLLV